MRIALLAAAAIVGLTWPAAAQTVAGQASIIDGDTLIIQGVHVRLAGIDAPESRQLCTDGSGAEYRCGKVAALALAGRVGRSTVTCVGAGHDRYRRLIATCTAGEIDLNGWLVEQGLAVAYRRYSMVYALQEDAAKAARRGLWAGQFTMPWDWRKHH